MKQSNPVGYVSKKKHSTGDTDQEKYISENLMRVEEYYVWQHLGIEEKIEALRVYILEKETK